MQIISRSYYLSYYPFFFFLPILFLFSLLILFLFSLLILFLFFLLILFLFFLLILFLFFLLILFLFYFFSRFFQFIICFIWNFFFKKSSKYTCIHFLFIYFLPIIHIYNIFINSRINIFVYNIRLFSYSDRLLI